jgi:hypothetical protein
MFNITDVDGIFYEDKDIDYDLNIGYVDYGYGEDKNSKDETLEKFIDYVPIKVPESIIYTLTYCASYDEAKYIRQITNRHNIVILPGTNHSNANYIYKLIKHEALQKNKYRIPYLSNDHRIPYKGNNKEAVMMINKEDVYNFIKNNSIIRKFN